MSREDHIKDKYFKDENGIDEALFYVDPWRVDTKKNDIEQKRAEVKKFIFNEGKKNVINENDLNNDVNDLKREVSKEHDLMYFLEKIHTGEFIREETELIYKEIYPPSVPHELKKEDVQILIQGIYSYLISKLDDEVFLKMGKKKDKLSFQTDFCSFFFQYEKYKVLQHSKAPIFKFITDYINIFKDTEEAPEIKKFAGQVINGSERCIVTSKELKEKDFAYFVQLDKNTSYAVSPHEDDRFLAANLNTLMFFVKLISPDKLLDDVVKDYPKDPYEIPKFTREFFKKEYALFEQIQDYRDKIY